MFFHPTQKPVDLIRYLIRTYTNPGDIVLDNCMGSGSTAIAALREDRHFIGFELDDHYYQVCMDRIADEINYVEEKKAEPKSLPLF
jgi:DNA modification methylase